VRLDADTGDFVEGRVVSVRLVNEGIPEPDPEQQAVDLARRLTRQDIPNAGITIAGDGTLALRQIPRTKKDKGLDRDAPMPGSQARPR
jgi:hypothetical protein